MTTLTFVPEQKHYRVKELGYLCSLPKLGPQGICDIANHSTGLGHCAHANIDQSGSVKGMKDQGYWRKTDKVALQGGYWYNLSTTVCSDPLDELCLAVEESRVQTTNLPDGTVIYQF